MDSTPGQVDRTPEGSLGPDAKAEYDFKRRLVVCLDGTWNARDSGTNIYHIANLVLEGRIDPTKEGDETWVQMVYYDQGVGTSLLTSATGGAFGVGLSENVRQAYDWLVERYREGDHIYIFGFSRGSFTARSLVGLISNCGLLYRGAPLPPEELWDGYKKMGPDIPPDKEPKTTTHRKRWQLFGGPARPRFHRLKYLKPDPGQDREEWEKEMSRVDVEEMNETERLLCTWSRRVPIECLAVYDTVRTLGIEALAIPWLPDKRSRFHDTRLTSLIRNGFHGLAIDEHRANFDNVPWHRPTHPGKATYGTIAQRWFIGAHSNIGGSYYDDTLAQHPLSWFIDECSTLKLVFKPHKRDEQNRPLEPAAGSETQPADSVPLLDDRNRPKKPAHICDSYTEFASGIWKNLIRAKRNYRRIAPLPEFQNGEEVISFNEDLHPSVARIMAVNPPAPTKQNYNPPNLYEYVYRPKNPSKEAEQIRNNSTPTEAPRHVYLDSLPAAGWLLGWLFSIAWGGAWLASFASSRVWYSLVIVLPVLAWLADWAESAVNFNLALEPDGPKAQRRDGILDVLLRVRLAAIGLFVIGAIYLLWKIVPFLFFDCPLAEAAWLLVLIGLMVQFHASQLWTAKPMREAGFGSIQSLQNARTPEAVHSKFKEWKARTTEPNLHPLTPVFQTIWRDMVGFIPSYAIAFFFGLWLLGSFIIRCFLPDYFGQTILGLLSSCIWSWGIAGAIVAIAVIADYIEDAAHRRYLDRSEEPPKSVWLGRLATRIKLVFAVLGTGGLAAAVLSLGLLQFYRPFAHLFPCPICRELLAEVGTVYSPAILNLVAAVIAILMAYSTVLAFPRGGKQDS